MTTRSMRAVIAGVATSCLLMGLSACAETSEKSAADAPAGRDLTSADLEDLVKFVGGKGGKADPALEPITLGWTNQDAILKGASDAMTAMEKVVNDELGGIDGHPVKIVQCPVASPQDYQSCGVKFANDGEMDAVMTGVVIVDSTPFYRALGSDMPVVVGAPLQPADFNQPNAVTYEVSTADLFKGYAHVPTDLPKDTPVRIINTASAISNTGNDNATKALEGAGYTDVETVTIPETATVPDVTSSIQSAGIKNGDILVATLTDAQCIAVDVATKSLSIEPGLFLATQGCATASVLKHFGGDTLPDNWRIVSQHSSPLVLDDPDVAIYTALMKKYVPSVDPNTPGPPQAIQAILNLVKIGNQVGADAPKDKWIDALKNFEGPGFMMPGSLDCGRNPELQSLCTTVIPIISYEDGKWVQTSVEVD